MARSDKSKKAPGKAKKWLVRGLKIGLVGAFAGLVAIGVAVFIAMQSLPDYNSLKSSPNGQMIRVHAADGTVFLSLGPNYGRWLTLDETPQVMQDAMVAVEDRRFYEHTGFDPIGMSRAMVTNLRAGRVVTR